MTFSKSLRTTIVTLALASIFAQVAAAGGEPKNEWPFTRPVVQRTTQAVVHHTAQANPPIQGEPKNEAPFTRPVGQRSTQAVVATTQANPLFRGEAKNEAPFTRRATVIVVSGHSFQWADSGIGVAAGIGIALSGLGALALARKSPRTA